MNVNTAQTHFNSKFVFVIRTLWILIKSSTTHEGKKFGVLYTKKELIPLHVKRKLRPSIKIPFFNIHIWNCFLSEFRLIGFNNENIKIGFHFFIYRVICLILEFNSFYPVDLILNIFFEFASYLSLFALFVSCLHFFFFGIQMLCNLHGYYHEHGQEKFCPCSLLANHLNCKRQRRYLIFIFYLLNSF